MRCPLDVDVDLVMTERQGVEIDYCPRCRGVWLDRGELDKILDRAAEQAPTHPSTRQPGAGGLAGGHVSGEGGTGLGYDPVLDAGPSAPGHGVAYGDDRARYRDDRAGYGDDRARYGDDRGGRAGYDPRRKKRKESWLGDLLDFG